MRGAQRHGREALRVDDLRDRQACTEWYDNEELADCDVTNAAITALRNWAHQWAATSTSDRRRPLPASSPSPAVPAPTSSRTSASPTPIPTTSTARPAAGSPVRRPESANLLFARPAGSGVLPPPLCAATDAHMTTDAPRNGLRGGAAPSFRAPWTRNDETSANLRTLSGRLTDAPSDYS